MLARIVVGAAWLALSRTAATCDEVFAYTHLMKAGGTTFSYVLAAATDRAIPGSAPYQAFDLSHFRQTVSVNGEFAENDWLRGDDRRRTNESDSTGVTRSSLTFRVSSRSRVEIDTRSVS